MKNKDIPLEPQAQGKENRSTEAQSSGTKKDANEKTKEIPANIQRSELDFSGAKYDCDFPSELVQYINRYMATRPSEKNEPMVNRY